MQTVAASQSYARRWLLDRPVRKLRLLTLVLLLASIVTLSASIFPLLEDSTWRIPSWLVNPLIVVSSVSAIVLLTTLPAYTAFLTASQRRNSWAARYEPAVNRFKDMVAKGRLEPHEFASFDDRTKVISAGDFPAERIRTAAQVIARGSMGLATGAIAAAVAMAILLTLRGLNVPKAVVATIGAAMTIVAIAAILALIAAVATSRTASQRTATLLLGHEAQERLLLERSYLADEARNSRGKARARAARLTSRSNPSSSRS